MPEIHHIKHLREKKGLSLSEIVRRTGFNWRTVKKYADGDISVRQKTSMSKFCSPPTHENPPLLP